MVGYFVVLAMHTSALLVLAYWYLRAYRKAAQRSRRELERILATDRTDRLEAELAFYKERHDMLLRGLSSGELLLGNFLDEDPELRALCDLIELVKNAVKPTPADAPTAVE